MNHATGLYEYETLTLTFPRYVYVFQVKLLKLYFILNDLTNDTTLNRPVKIV